MGMGMPFMSYDTMEDMILDPDRPDINRAGIAAAAGAAAGAAAAQRSAAVSATNPAVEAFKAKGSASPATGAAATDPAVLQSALQAALARVNG